MTGSDPYPSPLGDPKLQSEKITEGSVILEGLQLSYLTIIPFSERSPNHKISRLNKYTFEFPGNLFLLLGNRILV